jgi:cell division protein FtsB
LSVISPLSFSDSRFCLAISGKTVYNQIKGVVHGMIATIRRVGIAVAFAAMALYAAAVLRGPQGIAALMEQRKEIQALQAQNATLALENQRKKERIQRLKDSPSEQELEIRKQLKLLRPGETSFILPEAPSQPATPPASPAQ